MNGSGSEKWQDDLARRLRSARSTVVFTGAGVSAESGVATFRGPEGYWRQHRPEDLATPGAFARDPHFVWEWYDHRRIQLAEKKPNAAHRRIAEWEALTGRVRVVTQNVDGLHQLAGSRDVCCLHGDIWTLRCVSCGCREVNRDTPLRNLPPRCSCGALMRPGVVWFGESLPAEVWKRAEEACRNAELMVVVGTSAIVYPAGGLPLVAKARGCYLIEINLAPTDLTPHVDLFVQGKAGELLQGVDARVCA